MWDVLGMLIVLGGMVAVGLVSNVLLEELTEWPDSIRKAVRGPAAHRSLAVRVADLEARIAIAEKKAARPAA